MSSGNKPAPPQTRPGQRQRDEDRVGGGSDASFSSANPAAVVIVGWLIPGAAHALVGRLGKGAVFFVTLVAMFAVGIWSGGRLFPLQFDDPLVLLEAIA